MSVIPEPREASDDLQEIGLIGEPRRVDGYGMGVRQPSVLATARLLPVPADRLACVDAFLRARLELADPELHSTEPVDDTERYLLRWIRYFHLAGVHPVFEPAWIMPVGPRSPGVVTLLQPCLHHGACILALRLCLQLLQRASATADLDAAALAEEFGASVDSARRRFVSTGVSGFNTIHFLRAAHSLGLPWLSLPGQVFQFGFGAAARLLASSITDSTANIGVGWARNKQHSARLMRLAGLPVPQHKKADSARRSVEIAGELGYPVVVKPGDKDGGVGVSAGLNDAEAVERAYVKAVEHSSNVLVEKHVEGRDYRVQVVDGEVHGILERVPGGVVGDGTHDVRWLVERQNEERRTATDDRRYLHAIELDDEARAQLAAVSMTLESIPSAGQVVRLRGASNVAVGGVPVPVPLEMAHPDNLALSVRAARVLRLNVAGIDLLIPDIARSWLETGAGICEVNAQPQMFTTLHQPMLSHIMGEAMGRIPVVVVLERKGEASTGVARMIHAALCERMPGAALATSEGLWLGRAQMAGPPDELFDGARALLVDRSVQALVLEASGGNLLRRGWPVDRCDVFVMPVSARSADNSLDQSFLRLSSFAARLQPARVLVAAGNPRLVRHARGAYGDRLSELDPDDLAAFVRGALQAIVNAPAAAA